MNNLKNKFGEEYCGLKELPPYERAEVIADAMFKGITDEAGKPLIQHLQIVSGDQETEEGRIVGLLHCLLEKTQSTPFELAEIGYGEEIYSAISTLTKTEGLSYSEYIDRIINSNDELAIRVKEADIRNNLDPRRLNLLPEKVAEELIEKYSEPHQRILNKIGEIENDRHQTSQR